MLEPKANSNFEKDVLPHLDAAYNLARWLMRNDQDAQDVVQEVSLRAFQFFGGFRGGNARAWLLRIVRNTCYTWHRRKRLHEPALEFDETTFVPDRSPANPEEAVLRNDAQRHVRFALEALSPNLREVIILRELEGMSYKEISEVAGIPTGTVMSRLSRARGELRHSLVDLAGKNPSPEIGRAHV